MRKIILYAVLVLGLATSSLTQDFYNGCRGPKAFQIDTYFNKKGKTIIPKIFTKNLKKSLPDLVLAVPINDYEIKGINLGFIKEEKDKSYIAAIGIFKDDNGNYNILNPQLYSTYIKDNWTLDFEMNFPINISNKNIESSIAATLGYKINDRLRIGGSIIKNKGQDLET